MPEMLFPQAVGVLASRHEDCGGRERKRRRRARRQMGAGGPLGDEDRQGGRRRLRRSRDPDRRPGRCDRGRAGQGSRARGQDGDRRNEPLRRGSAGGICVQRRVRQVQDERPTAKSFNVNFAALYDRIGSASAKPGNLWSGDEEAREVVEQLNRDAGFEPIHAGGLENARAQEDFLTMVGAVRQNIGPFFYRMAPPDEF
jgi:hypothetical protein